MKKNMKEIISSLRLILNIFIFIAIATSCDLTPSQTSIPHLEIVTVAPEKAGVITPSIVYPSATATLLAYSKPGSSQEATPFQLPETFAAPLPISTLWNDTPYPPPETFPTPVQTPVSLPSIAYDLIYMGSTGPNDYELLYWDHRTGETKALVTQDTSSSVGQDNFTLSGNVSAYSISKDGKKMVVLRVVDRPMNSQWYEFVYFEIQNKQINPLTRSDTKVYQLAISPDGQRIGYLSDGKLYFFDIFDPGRIYERGNCEGYCLNFTWSPDSQSIAMSNEYGIWISDLIYPTPRLLAANRMLWVRDDTLAVFALPPWSPNGRFLLAWEPVTENGEWYVIDVQDNRSAKIPNSLLYPYPLAQSFWLQDGQLCVARSGDIEKNHAPSIEIWQITPEKENLITLYQTIPIKVNPNLYLISPGQLEDGRIAFVLIEDVKDLPNLIDESGLYAIDSDNIPTRISGPLPQVHNPSMINADWTPDGNGVIFHDLGDGHFYIDVKGRLQPVIKRPSCCFTWIK